MSRIAQKPLSQTLVDFIKENESKLYTFCILMLDNKEEVEWTVLETLDEFSDYFRKRSQNISNSELKMTLFSFAWKLVNETEPQDPTRWLNGRDTRKMIDWNKDLLTAWTKSHELTEPIQSGLFKRLKLISFEYRGPLILKDILHFEDEEILRILGSRWGVYRHRLHRGRLDLLQGLKGSAPQTGVHV